MTGAVIPPVVPAIVRAARDPDGRGAGRGTALVPTHAARPADGGLRRPLPVPPLRGRPTPGVVYGVATVDRCGRLASRHLLRALGWPPGRRLEIRDADDVLVIHADPAGAFRTTGHGDLRVPARVRRRCGLLVGDRVLLAADPASDRLLVFPPTVVDAMIAARHARHARLVGGERA